MDKFEADIYVIGYDSQCITHFRSLQEIDMTAAALLKEETDVGHLWMQGLANTFKEVSNNYIQIAAKQLVGLYITVFIKKEHEKFVTDVRIGHQGVGIMGSMGNKGGVGVRFNFYASKLCFVNTHLVPHEEAVERRNQNFRDIMYRPLFSGGVEYMPENHEYEKKIC